MCQTGLVEAGFAQAVLWVVPSNLRARRFYEHAGWSADNLRRTVQVHGVSIEEIRYQRTLAAG